MEEEFELEFRRRVAELEKSFKAIDDAFQKWKEGVLKFEHSRIDIGNDPDGDDLLCDGECVRTSEDEDDIQQPSESNDREIKVCCGVLEEGGQNS